jgi:hypothetical protein
MRLVGLRGYAQAGKDTAALGLGEEGWARVAFADPLKHVARALGWDGKKDDDGRQFLQDLGKAVRDHVHPDAWVWAAEREIDELERGGLPGVVVTDVRYPNEVEMIHRRGGIVVEVVRPGVGPANYHESEHALVNVPPDFTLANDDSIRALMNGLALLVATRLPRPR